MLTKIIEPERKLWTPMAKVEGLPQIPNRQWLDLMCEHEARRLQLRQELIRCGGAGTQSYAELIFANRQDHTALSSFTSEASLLAGTNEQAVLPRYYFDGLKGFGKTIVIEAMGVFSSTSTPTFTFQVRLGSTIGTTYLSGTSVGVSAAITTASSVTNKPWYLRLDLTCNLPGQGATATTLSGAGWVQSPSFASPYLYPLEPTTPDTSTWTSTINAAVDQFVNLSVTCSTSSSSNTIQCKSLKVMGLN